MNQKNRKFEKIMKKYENTKEQSPRSNSSGNMSLLKSLAKKKHDELFMESHSTSGASIPEMKTTISDTNLKIGKIESLMRNESYTSETNSQRKIALLEEKLAKSQISKTDIRKILEENINDLVSNILSKISIENISPDIKSQFFEIYTKFRDDSWEAFCNITDVFTKKVELFDDESSLRKDCLKIIEIIERESNKLQNTIEIMENKQKIKNILADFDSDVKKIDLFSVNEDSIFEIMDEALSEQEKQLKKGNKNINKYTEIIEDSKNKIEIMNNLREKIINRDFNKFKKLLVSENYSKTYLNYLINSIESNEDTELYINLLNNRIDEIQVGEELLEMIDEKITVEYYTNLKNKINKTVHLGLIEKSLEKFTARMQNECIKSKSSDQIKKQLEFKKYALIANQEDY